MLPCSLGLGLDPLRVQNQLFELHLGIQGSLGLAFTCLSVALRCLLVDWGMLGLRVATFGMFGWFSYAVGRAEAYVGKNHQGNHQGNHREGTFKEDG